MRQAEKQLWMMGGWELKYLEARADAPYKQCETVCNDGRAKPGTSERKLRLLVIVAGTIMACGYAGA